MHAHDTVLQISTCQAFSLHHLSYLRSFSLSVSLSAVSIYLSIPFCSALYCTALYRMLLYCAVVNCPVVSCTVHCTLYTVRCTLYTVLYGSVLLGSARLGLPCYAMPGCYGCAMAMLCSFPLLLGSFSSPDSVLLCCMCMSRCVEVYLGLWRPNTFLL